jgi:hypothetical protein
MNEYAAGECAPPPPLIGHFVVKSNNSRDSCALLHRWGLFSMLSGKEKLSKRVRSIDQITSRLQS